MESENHFIASLAADDIAALAPHLKEVELKRDEVICEAHDRVKATYLPLNCILSVITTMSDGSQVESRTIGKESGFGLLHALGTSVSHERMICQVGGRAMRVGLAELNRVADARPGLRRAVAQHAQATVVQMAQSTACNILHPAHQRLARWLLMTQERLGGDVLPLTQEHLSIMLGVQRTTVTPLAQHLQDQGIITYSRGKIKVLDTPGLQRRSCECYEAVRRSVEETFSNF